MMCDSSDKLFFQAPSNVLTLTTPNRLFSSDWASIMGYTSHVHAFCGILLHPSVISRLETGILKSYVDEMIEEGNCGDSFSTVASCDPIGMSEALQQHYPLLYLFGTDDGSGSQLFVHVGEALEIGENKNMRSMTTVPQPTAEELLSFSKFMKDMTGVDDRNTYSASNHTGAETPQFLVVSYTS